jgi:hypothetical protein
MEVRMPQDGLVRPSSAFRRLAFAATVLAAVAVLAACTSHGDGRWPWSSGAQRLAADAGLELGTAPRDPAPAALSSDKGKAEDELERLANSASAPRASRPGPDDWRVITKSLVLFRHAPYVIDMVLGLLVAIGVALALTSTPRRAVRFDPVAVAQQRMATVVCALIGCIAAELIQASEEFLLGAEIALVLFGIGGLVRFRTVFDDARQTGLAIVATVLGLACGMSEYSLVAIGLVIVYLANWYMQRVAVVRIRVRGRKGCDLAQLQAAVTSLLQKQDFQLLRVTPASSEREVEFFARTVSEFDVDALSGAVQGALPGVRVRINVS